ncbi:MAG: inositol monophosphatase family protein [Gemmatimonadota bacterium]
MSGIKLARALEVAQTAARAAGRFIQDSRQRVRNAVVEHKSPADVAGSIEREAESLIRTRIAAVFPEHGFVGSELGGSFDARRAQWLIDAIDAGANYRYGYPHYAVSIGLQHQGEVVLGVIYDPNRDELFTATRGQGAFCNGARIACSIRSRTADALAATVFPAPSSERMPQYVAEVGRMVAGFGSVHRSGAVALELAYLAAGRIDAFWAHEMGDWDAAAAIVLVREAGARFESLDRAPLLASHELLAATPSVFTAARSILLNAAA